MESSAVGWKIVPNTVTSRMRDSSLIHKLIPSKRLRRRCKAMNITIKRHHHHLKTYSQYVKMKTAVLRNLSEDNETDVSDSFTENDYSTLHKPDLSLRSYKTLTPSEKINYLYLRKSSINKSGIVCRTANKKAVTQKVKNKCLKVTNLGWQEVIKNKNKSIINNTNENNNLFTCPVGSQKMDDQRDIKNNLQIANTNKHSSICFKESSMIQKSETLEDSEVCAVEKVVELNIKVTDPNEIKYDISELQEIMDDNNKLVEQIDPTINEVNQRFQADKNHYCETSDSREMQTVEGIEKNLTSLLDDINETKNDNNSFANIKAYQDESHSSSSEESANDQGTSADKNKASNRLLKIQPSLIGNTNQPKDSGIEEDTEEEFLENRSRNHKKGQNKIQETQQNEQTVPSSLNQRNNSIVQTGLSTSNDYLLSEDHNVSNNTSPKDMQIFLDEDICNSGDNKKKVQKYKLQPVVTCTEIVNKKYKIIKSCDTPLSNNRTSPELCLNDFHSKKAIEIQEMEQTIEDTVSPLTKKRLQQLRRLNLTTESESGLSEDDNMCCNVENMRDNLLKRSRESLDTSDSENENIKSKLTMLIQFNKKLQENKNSKIEDCNKGNTLKSDINSDKHMKNKKSKRSKGKESIESLGLTEFNNNSYKSMDKGTPVPERDSDSTGTYYETGLSNFIVQTTICSDRKDSISKPHSIIQKNPFYDSEVEKEFSDENRPAESVTQILNKRKLVIQDRPCNLQELIDKDSLVHQTGIPSFRFKDIHEDDIFILDIPSMAFEKNLLGKKMILTEKKLKLGKQKYKVEYKNINNISCIFGSRKSHKPYKTVNIKPITRIIARQKIIKTPLLKFSTQSISDESNSIEDNSKIEDNVTLTKRHIEMKQKVPFKRKQYDII